MFYKSWWTQNAMGYYRLWVITVWVISDLTVSLVDTKSYELLQVMSYHRFNSLCVLRVGGLKMLWVITGYGLSQYGLSQV